MQTQIIMPKAVSAKSEIPFNIMGHMVTTKLHSWDGNDNYIFSMVSPSGSGIPPHVHESEDETIYILEGEFEVMVGDKTFKAVAGDCLNFVRGIPHAYTNIGNSDARTIWYVSPGKSFENFFNTLSRFPAGPPDMEKLNELCAQHAITFLV